MLPDQFLTCNTEKEDEKGLYSVIKNDRPFDELMLGLEAWIPLYMTGQVSPYFLKGKHNDVYCRINYASGIAALSGECITGHHNEGKYYVTKKSREVEYYNNKVRLLFKKAHPLMQIYTSDNASQFYSFLESEQTIQGDRRYILSTPPLYTLSLDVLENICNRHNLSEIDREKILTLYTKQVDGYKTLVLNNHIEIQLYVMTKEDF